MKTKTSLLLLILLVLTITSCVSKSEYEKLDQHLKECNKANESIKANNQTLLKNCDLCRTATVSSPQLPKGTDLTLRIDFKDLTKYQPFQYDILNGYGILGKLKMKNKHKIDSINFNLFEVGNCKRYYVKNITYEGKKSGSNIHKIKFEIGKLAANTARNPKYMNMNHKSMKIKKGDLINVQIFSKDFPELNAPPIPKEFMPTKEGDEYDFEGYLKYAEQFIESSDYGIKIFPPFICQGKLTYGNGN